ncbi:hypothetical protein F7R14_08510 [Pseudomonas lini]|uniref:Uncharacterized protein n=1 Tax=Pseudomonas lini TaxID=163011 RepID=A0A7V7TQ54_9PSED|nr:hypothetical protein F7R14_08510 [Pseudomonas lini]
MPAKAYFGAPPPASLAPTKSSSLIIPTLCVGMPPGTLRVPVTQSVTRCIPLLRVGTIGARGSTLFKPPAQWFALRRPEAHLVDR